MAGLSCSTCAPMLQSCSSIQLSPASHSMRWGGAPCTRIKQSHQTPLSPAQLHRSALRMLSVHRLSATTHGTQVSHVKGNPRCPPPHPTHTNGSSTPPAVRCLMLAMHYLPTLLPCVYFTTSCTELCTRTLTVHGPAVARSCTICPSARSPSECVPISLSRRLSCRPAFGPRTAAGWGSGSVVDA